MLGRRTQHHSPLILQLLKNREEQQAAEAQKEIAEADRGLRFSAEQPTERADFGPVLEWAMVLFQIFGLSLFSGSFFLVLVSIWKLTH